MDPVEEILNVPFKPWEHMSYTIKKTVVRTIIRRRYGHRDIHSYDAQFSTLENYNRSTWKLGDVVKFGKGYHVRKVDGWQTWFLNKMDYHEHLKRNRCYDRTIPAYARNNYAIVLARYKWTKYKDCCIFRDYGTFIMMLTGSKVGHIRKYYIKCPYQYIGRYPYTKMRYNLNREKLFHGVERVEDVKVFLENLVRKIAI